MTATPRSCLLSRMTCAAGAVIVTAVIGLSIDALAHHYDMTAEALASAKAVVVAQAPQR